MKLTQSTRRPSLPVYMFNAFSAYTATMLNILTIHAMRKTSLFPKSLKTLCLSLAVSNLGVGLLVQPLYIVKIANPSYGVYHHHKFVCYCFVLSSGGLKCLQIISDIRNSQASRCCGDLNLDIERPFSAIKFVFELKKACFRGYGCYHFRVLFHYYGNCLLQNSISLQVITQTKSFKHKQQRITK